MPNTPALVGAAATAICGNANAGPDDMQTARQLFQSVGIKIFELDNLFLSQPRIALNTFVCRRQAQSQTCKNLARSVM